MRYFNYLSPLQEEGIFFKQSNVITKYAEKELLQYALGGTLYMPAIRENIADMVISKKYPELGSMVICLEDAVGDKQLEDAVSNLVRHVKDIYDAFSNGQITIEELPLIFIRVRNPHQMIALANRLHEWLHVLTGFVFPKLAVNNAEEYFRTLIQIVESHDVILYGMPILETEELINLETRYDTILALKQIFDKYKDRILNIRIGATDLCGLYGIRRNYHTTVYDITIIRDLISNVMNYFGREFVISGPVWEYFENNSRILKPELRQTPFKTVYGKEGLEVRTQLLNTYEDGLIKETLLDLANGITGKTVIHPSHLKIVQGLNVITKEEYLDALSIIDQSKIDTGVVKSSFSNKMNEIKPHLNWAEKILYKSRIYGVYHENSSYVDILANQNQINN